MTLETLKTGGVGSSTDLTPVPNPPNWSMCYDNDGDTEYVRSSTTDELERTDLYAMQDSLAPAGSTGSVTLHAVIRSTHATYRASFAVALKTHGTTYFYAATASTVYVDRTAVLATNPFTGAAWTVQEVIDMEVGIRIGSTEDLFGIFWQGRCTQVYAVFDYTVPSVSSGAAHGNMMMLFLACAWSWMREKRRKRVASAISN